MQDNECHERVFWADLRRKVREARAAIDAGDVVYGPSYMRAKIASLKTRASLIKSAVPTTCKTDCLPSTRRNTQGRLRPKPNT
jgi:hypothetical protein